MKIPIKTAARIAGVLYMIIIGGGIFAELAVRGRLVVPGDAAATAYNILEHETIYRFGLVAELFCCACNVPINIIFYRLFAPVQKSLTLLALLFSFVGTAIEAASLIYHYAPLVLLKGGPSLAAWKTGQLQALAYMSLQLFERGFAIALVFFGFFCISIGWLINKSAFMPRLIGILLLVEGLCYLVNSFANFLAPGFAAYLFPLLMVSGLAEVSLCLWLLLIGVNVKKWEEKANADNRVK